DERKFLQLGMRQDAPERVLAYVSLSDVLMPVNARAQRRFRIVGMDQLHVLHAENAIRVAYRLEQSRLAADIEAGREQMAGIQAISDGQVRETGRQVAYGVQFFKARADVASAARGAFNEQSKI